MLVRHKLTAAAVMAVVGCSTIATNQTSRYYPEINTVVIETSTTTQARILCEALGADYSRARARAAAGAPTGAPFPNYGHKYGCYWGRLSDPAHAGVDIVVCPRGDQECLAHEFRHQREGQFHHS